MVDFLRLPEPSAGCNNNSLDRSDSGCSSLYLNVCSGSTVPFFLKQVGYRHIRMIQMRAYDITMGFERAVFVRDLRALTSLRAHTSMHMKLVEPKSHNLWGSYVRNLKPFSAKCWK